MLNFKTRSHFIVYYRHHLLFGQRQELDPINTLLREVVNQIGTLVDLKTRCLLTDTVIMT